jgi:hypothetical protein
MAQKKKIRRPQRAVEDLTVEQRGLGQSAGQSGDLQGLPEVPESSPESVEELVEEGQSWEAAAVSGVEEADAKGNPAEVHTHEVPEDDVPDEYLERD